jgi:phospholipid/cholesterol/gamma-HCH transport system permease protein
MPSSLGFPIALLGRNVRLASRRNALRIAFLGSLLRAPLGVSAPGRASARRTFMQQVRFTSVSAVPLIVAVGVVLGTTVILSAYSQAARFGVSELTTRLLVVAVIRELGPLLTAIIVVGRSGTAIAAELATNRVLGEIEALESLGVDPAYHFALPRVLAVSLSVVVLMIFLQGTAMFSGMMAASAVGSVALTDSIASLHVVLQPGDIYVSLVKGLLFGAGVGALCSFEGLTCSSDPTQLPQAVSRAMVTSFVFLFAATALFSVIVFR